MIEGLRITPLQQIKDERGRVMHMLRRDSDVFQQFGEVYFSTVFGGATKAWRSHKSMTLNYAVVFGRIQVVLFDDRPDSSSQGRVQRIEMSNDNYFLLTVPPVIWTGFRNLGSEEAIIANCASHLHDPDEVQRLPANSTEIPFRWSRDEG